MTLWWLRISVFVLCLVAPAAALADEAEEQMQRGLQSEKSLDFPSAEAAYARALELRPSASFAHRARIRLEDLRAHAEGGYEPLRRLEEIRRSPQRSSDAAVLEAFWGEAQRFPVGRVQAESLLLLSEAFGRRLNLPERALAPASLLARTASFDRPLRSRGLEVWVDALLALGRREQAQAALAELPGLSPGLEKRFSTERRRLWMDRSAQGVLAMLALMLLVALGKLRGSGAVLLRALKASTSLICVGLLIGIGSLLTLLFDESLSVRPFVLLGLGVWLVDRSVALGREALGRPPTRRVPLALLGVASVVAWAYLSLRLSDPHYLESFGL